MNSRYSKLFEILVFSATLWAACPLPESLAAEQVGNTQAATLNAMAIAKLSVLEHSDETAQGTPWENPALVKNQYIAYIAGAERATRQAAVIRQPRNHSGPAAKSRPYEESGATLVMLDSVVPGHKDLKIAVQMDVGEVFIQPLLIAKAFSQQLFGGSDRWAQAGENEPSDAGFFPALTCSFRALRNCFRIGPFQIDNQPAVRLPELGYGEAISARLRKNFSAEYPQVKGELDLTLPDAREVKRTTRQFSGAPGGSGITDFHITPALSVNPDIRFEDSGEYALYFFMKLRT